MTAKPTSAVSRPKAVTTASQWVQQNQAKLRKYRGKWIAVAKTGIVGKSDDFDEVFSKARTRGIDNPLVFEVPTGGRRKVVSIKKR